MQPEMMNTREVAEYLRIKERKVYDLVRDKRIPCARVTGKWLFPKTLIDQWVAQGTEYPAESPGLKPLPPAVAVGSHDPLLEWCLRESGAELPLLSGGSLDGLKRMAAGEASLCGLHVLDGDTGDYNLHLVRDALRGRDVVAIHWAWRRQGLVTQPGNPLHLAAIADLATKKPRIARRQQEAGSQILLVHLLTEAGIKMQDLNILTPPARSETDLALAVLEGKADCGLAVEAAARSFRLDFVPLARERFDLIIDRRAYFGTPIQKLLAFARTPALAARAAELSGYDVTDLGKVLYSA